MLGSGLIRPRNTGEYLLCIVVKPSSPCPLLMVILLHASSGCLAFMSACCVGEGVASGVTVLGLFWEAPYVDLAFSGGFSFLSRLSKVG